MSRYVLWLEWRGFYCDSGLEEPQVVEREKHVLDINRAARRCGIRREMPVTLARSIRPDCRIKPWRAAEYSTRQVEWLDLCAAFTGCLEPLDQHIAALDLSSHVRPCEIAEAVIEHLLRQVGLPLRYGAGPSKWVARLASRHLELEKAVRQPAQFIANLSVAELAPVPLKHRERLEFLGYHTIGDLRGIPAKILLDQFQADGFAIARAAEGKGGGVVQALYPPDTLSEVLRFESPVADYQTVLAALPRLADKVGEKLLGKQAGSIHLMVATEENRQIDQTHALKKPVHDGSTLLASLRRLWAMIACHLTEPISALRLQVAQLEPALPVQVDFLAKSRSSPRGVIDLLKGAYGEDAVSLASQLRLSRREQVLQAWKDATGWT